MIDTGKMCQRLKRPCSKRVPLNPNMEAALLMLGKWGLPSKIFWLNEMFADGHTAANAPDLF